MNSNNKKESKFDVSEKSKNTEEHSTGAVGSGNGTDRQKIIVGENAPVSGTAQTQFNKNRKIIIRNVPPVTYEV